MDLYDFQKEDIEKLMRQQAALIGSEMGTGKTHEAIELDAEWFDSKGQKPTLVVAPLNTFASWQEKYSFQMPDVDVVTIDRKHREKFVQDIRKRRGDVFLMHWDALRLMPELAGIQFNTVIADEVHRASNRKAQATMYLKHLKTEHKLGLSGTASGDRPDNLWSILNWLWPTYYRSYWNFRKHYCIEEMVERGHGDDAKTYRQITGVQNIASLMAEMEPWYVRHLKRDACCAHHPDGVMWWLPEKTYDTIWVDLSPKQRRAYEQMRKEMVAWVGEHEDTPLTASIVVAQMTRLSQMALATPEVDTIMVQAKDKETGEKLWLPDGTPHMVPKQVVTLVEPSSKIDAVKELILDHGEKQFVVFSSSKQACYLAEQNFARAGITSEVLSGDTPQSSRDDMVARFNRGDFQVFIGVIQAAAEGIDGLQHSTDTAIFLDRSWSTIKNKQAEDRLHRDGQKNAVQIIDVMARNTVDFGRAAKLERKWSWIRAILGDGAQSRVLQGEL